MLTEPGFASISHSIAVASHGRASETLCPALEPATDGAAAMFTPGHRTLSQWLRSSRRRSRASALIEAEAEQRRMLPLPISGYFQKDASAACTWCSSRLTRCLSRRAQLRRACETRRSACRPDSAGH